MKGSVFDLIEYKTGLIPKQSPFYEFKAFKKKEMKQNLLKYEK